MGATHTHDSGRGLVSNKGRERLGLRQGGTCFTSWGRRVARRRRAGGGWGQPRVGHHQRALSPSVCLSVSSSLSLPATVGSGLLSSSLRRGSAASGQSVGQSPHSLCQWLAHSGRAALSTGMSQRAEGRRRHTLPPHTLGAAHPRTVRRVASCNWLCRLPHKDRVIPKQGTSRSQAWSNSPESQSKNKIGGGVAR